MSKVYTVMVSNSQERVYHSLRDQIMELTLKPGTIISTQEIADQFGVSRTPVREAFIRLQKEMLLEVSPQSATMVSKINMDRVRQEHFIRESLEVENLEKFKHIDNPHLYDRLEEYIKNQTQCLQEHDFCKFMEWDNIFHMAQLEATGEHLSAELIGNLNGHFDRFRLLTIYDSNLSQNTVNEHRALLELYRSKSWDAAKFLLQTHLQHLWVQSEQMKEQWPDFFTD